MKLLNVGFNIDPLNIELETDGAARSAPFEILNFSSCELEDEQMVYQLIKEIRNAIIFDIGANIGWHTINFAKRLPDAKIYSFEPIQQTYEFLEKNVKRNSIKNCVLMNYGISNENREAFLYYFKSGSAIASIENLIEHPNAKKEKCFFKTLDKIFSDLELDRIDFIKCDVEGSELFVLQGAEKILQDIKPILLIEICEEWCQKCKYHSKDIIHFLKSRGYDFFSTSDGKILERRKKIRSIDQGKYNYFFLHKEKHRDLINQLCDPG